MLSTTAPILLGVAVGAFAVTALAVWRSELGRDAKLTTVLTCLSAAAWTLTESEQTSLALGRPLPLFWLAFPAVGFFWTFVVCLFDDRPLRWFAFIPAASFLILGIAITIAPPGLSPWLLAAFNIAATGFSLHAMILILRGWRGDLVDSRRSSRIIILGIAALFAAAQGLAGTLHWLGPDRPWASFAMGEDFGAIATSALGLAMGALLLQARTSLFSLPVRPAPSADAKLAVAERLLLAKLEALMHAGAWRQEGLSIGTVARDLGTQEYRLRRLINATMGHRNFSDFVNGFRIEAAKERLADATQIDVTIASIAFDLGFGSLSPFNRAFRASTGSTPTAWRRAALAAKFPPDAG